MVCSLLLKNISYAQTQPSNQIKHPNIVLFLVDNEPNIALGTYGGLGAETPNTDKFAQEGIKFTRAYATNTYCSPTRASLLTGLMPSQHGVHDALYDDIRLFPNDWAVVQEFRTIHKLLQTEDMIRLYLENSIWAAR